MKSISFFFSPNHKFTAPGLLRLALETPMTSSVYFSLAICGAICAPATHCNVYCFLVHPKASETAAALTRNIFSQFPKVVYDHCKSDRRCFYYPCLYDLFFFTVVSTFHSLLLMYCISTVTIIFHHPEHFCIYSSVRNFFFPSFYSMYLICTSMASFHIYICIGMAIVFL